AGRDGRLFPAVGAGGAGARRHRSRCRWHLPLGAPGVRAVARLRGGLGLLGQQPLLLSFAARRDGGDRRVRGWATLRALERRQSVHRRAVPGGAVARRRYERGRPPHREAAPEPGRVRHVAAGAHLRAARGVVAILLALGNLGGVGAWLAGSARLPFVAGIDDALPPAFGRIHPRWHTPHVGLLVQGGLATVFVVASLVGATVKNAYLALTQTT